ncbi:MAG: hypothetical protein LBQ52_04850 [Helicobacteraceae bacterium]|jgi:hypothetical protein|nr:hypothetical protein [Helicobacteraceae bacterium]
MKVNSKKKEPKIAASDKWTLLIFGTTMGIATIFIVASVSWIMAMCMITPAIYLLLKNRKSIKAFFLGQIIYPLWKDRESILYDVKAFFFAWIVPIVFIGVTAILWIVAIVMPKRSESDFFAALEQSSDVLAFAIVFNIIVLYLASRFLTCAEDEK